MIYNFIGCVLIVYFLLALIKCVPRRQQKEARSKEKIVVGISGFAFTLGNYSICLRQVGLVAHKAALMFAAKKEEEKRANTS